jgi:hypothetical protein
MLENFNRKCFHKMEEYNQTIKNILSKFEHIDDLKNTLDTEKKIVIKNIKALKPS